MIKSSNHRVQNKIINADIIEKNGLMIGNRSYLFSEKDKKALHNLKRIIENS